MRGGLFTAASIVALLAGPGAAITRDAPANVVPGGVLTGTAVAGAVVDEERDCNQLQPEASALGQVSGPFTPDISLDVLVLTERVDLAVARALFSKAAEAYAPLGIQLTPRFRVIRAVPDLDGRSEDYLVWLKEQVGGRRPKGTDVVYLATHHYLGAAGQADCIGGVADPRHAFAVGMLEFGGLGGVEIGGVDEPEGPPVPHSGAKLAAHEIGHLLGAHHHYGGDCTGTEPGHPCDVMLTLSPQTLGLRFGVLNAAVVRDQAVRFARP